MRPLHLVEELIELVQAQLYVHALPLILFVKQVQLQIYKALTVAVQCAITGGDPELVLKVDQLIQMHI